MRPKHLLLLLSVCLMFGGCTAIKQKLNRPLAKEKLSEADKRFGFHFKGRKQSYAKVPFELSSNLIIVKITIDDSDTLNFILDTGVSSTIITDPEIANKIGLNYVRKVLISGAGEGEPITASVSVGHKLNISEDIVAYQQNVVVINENTLNLSEYLGIPIHGIFGNDVFETFVVSIDFENKQLHLSNPKTFKFRRSYGVKYPIVVTQSKPYTEAISLVDNGEIKPMKLVIDTGAGHALMLNTNNKDENIDLPEKVIRANLGRGLNGDINGHLGRVSKLKMGKVEINNILASFPDSISFSMKFPPTDFDRQGSIGCELLRRFRVTLNYRESYIALKPVKVRMKETFEHDMSGLEVRADIKQLNRYYVRGVDDYSPAGLAGIEKGDELVFINNRSTSNLNINEILTILSKKEGRDIELFVRRKGKLKFYYFTLKRFI